MDVVTAFLNPKIDRDNIYMEMPLGIDWLASSGSASTGSASSTGSVLILQILLVLCTYPSIIQTLDRFPNFFSVL